MSAFNPRERERDTPEAKLLESYRPASDAYDELLAEHGGLRPRWRAVLETFGGEPPTDAQEKARRLLTENGVTFIAQGERGRTRPWRLDLFPLLIDPAEWTAIESAVVQRARLLNALLFDLYGAQRALEEQVLPPGLVFGNPRFLRPCAQVAVRDNLHVNFAAFDLARATDGRWWVLSDRTQSPSGAGYALENRVVTSQCLPEPFATSNVRRLASFFRAFREHFLSLSRREQPSAVFLSPGPSQRTYFEHAYLARYLGFSVVEGSDLTVRDERVFLRTVAGLKRVDLIMRRIPGELCDPLELRTDSLLGVPGLLQAVRAGKVTICNALGSGLAESDGFLSFLPSLSRYYLGEDLAMPSVATWWCGQPEARRYVLEHLDELIVRRISSARTLFGSQPGSLTRPGMAASDRERLKAEIERNGHDFVGQEVPALSRAPVWTADGKLEAAPVVLRVYVGATPAGYEVMPGGLTRVATRSDPRAAWLAAGDASKDTWVLSDQPVEQFSLLAERRAAERLHRGGRDLTSRAADSLFWLGRYAERAEGAVRLLRSLVLRLTAEMGSTRSAVTPERVVSILIVQKHLSPKRGRHAIQGGREAVEQELSTILFDPECKDGLATVLASVRRNAEALRERLSFDTFRILRDLTELSYSSQLNPRYAIDDALRLLNRLIQYLAAFNGMVMENMTRGYGWRFLEMGRRLERLRTVFQLVRQLTVRGDPESDGGLELLLELADSTMTYRGRYLAMPQLPAVLDLLLCDDSNPRSALFQIVTLAEHMRHLPRAEESGLMSPDERIATRLESDLKLADPLELGRAPGRFDARVDLDRLAKRIDRNVQQLSNRIAERFFSHSSAQHVTGAARIESAP